MISNKVDIIAIRIDQNRRRSVLFCRRRWGVAFPWLVPPPPSYCTLVASWTLSRTVRRGNSRQTTQEDKGTTHKEDKGEQTRSQRACYASILAGSRLLQGEGDVEKDGASTV